MCLLVINIIQFVLVNKIPKFPSESSTGKELTWGVNLKKLTSDYSPNLICKNLGYGDLII